MDYLSGSCLAHWHVVTGTSVYFPPMQDNDPRRKPGAIHLVGYLVYMAAFVSTSRFSIPANPQRTGVEGLGCSVDPVYGTVQLARYRSGY